jgi:hypothetical protein
MRRQVQSCSVPSIATTVAKTQTQMSAMARGPITFLKKVVLSKMTSLILYRGYLSPSFCTIVKLFDRFVKEALISIKRF